MAHNKGMTVNELAVQVMDQIAKGNGDKHILISNDDEGNGYHTLFYAFMDDVNEIKETKEFSWFHDDNDPEEVVILG